MPPIQPDPEAATTTFLFKKVPQNKALIVYRIERFERKVSGLIHLFVPGILLV